MIGDLKKDNIPICRASHPASEFYFCSECADKKEDLMYIFYCKKCDMKIHVEKHKVHASSRMKIEDSKYDETFEIFKTHLRLQYRNQRESFIENSGIRSDSMQSSKVFSSFKHMGSAFALCLDINKQNYR